MALVFERGGRDFTNSHVNHNLSWEKHTQKISKKVSQGLYALSRTKHIIPKHLKKLIYNALVESHITYGITLWGHTHKKHLKPIITQQKKAIRLIENAAYNEHTNPLFINNKIIKLPEIIELHILKFMHRIINKIAPQQILTLFPQRPRNTHIESRNLDIHIPLFRKSSSQNSIFYQGPKQLTTLPHAIKEQMQQSTQTLSKHYKHHLLRRYNTNN